MKKDISKKVQIYNIVTTFIVLALYYYFLLPPMNVHSPEFWFFIGFGIFTYGLLTMVKGEVHRVKGDDSAPKGGRILLALIVIIFAIMLVNFIASPVFNADSYSKRITINEGSDFAADVEEVDFSKLPLLDKASTRKVGDRVMGELPEYVSQFDVSDLYTQINYNNDIVRVTPLEYSDVIKYFTNRKEGIKAYIMVDSTSGKSNLVELEEGVRYMPSALFAEDLDRKLRITYPTAVFGRKTFEVDEEGNPHWIIPVISYQAVGIKEEIYELIIFNPITGDSEKYNVADVPTWVDHVHRASLVLEQTNDWGKYRSGFLNSIFGQKNVVQTTEGYNYLAMNDDVYLYTGITSAVNDESNLGFILTNLRTKETNYYKVPGAEEYSAMGSAEGQVQQMEYRSTFPLLINLAGNPTYLMSLKDNAGLVKMYAFVDVENYQNVTVTASSEGVEAAATNFLNERKPGEKEASDASKTKEISIKTISSAYIGGNSYYYILDNENQKYKVSLAINESLIPFLKAGDKLKVTYQEIKEINIIREIEVN